MKLLRAALATALAGALTLGAATGTFAADDPTLTTSPATATIANLMPGKAKATQFAVTNNAATTRAKVAVVLRGSGTLLSAGGALQVWVDLCATPWSPSGTNWVCTGASTPILVGWTATAAPSVPTTFTLPAGATTHALARVRLAASSSNSTQQKSVALSLTFQSTAAGDTTPTPTPSPTPTPTPTPAPSPTPDPVPSLTPAPPAKPTPPRATPTPPRATPTPPRATPTPPRATPTPPRATPTTPATVVPSEPGKVPTGAPPRTTTPHPGTAAPTDSEPPADKPHGGLPQVAKQAVAATLGTTAVGGSGWLVFLLFKRRRKDDGDDDEDY